MTDIDFTDLTEFQSELVLDSFTTYARECRETPGCEVLVANIEALRAAWLRTHQARFPVNVSEPPGKIEP